MNSSGIEPIGRKILVKPDEFEQVSDGGIIVATDSDLDKYNQATSTGVVIAVGPDAFTHGTEHIYRVENGQLKLVEKRVDGFGDSKVAPGDRVIFAKFAGKGLPGADGEQYRIINDQDITAFASPEVNFSKITNKRKRIGSNYE